MAYSPRSPMSFLGAAAFFPCLCAAAIFAAPDGESEAAAAPATSDGGGITEIDRRIMALETDISRLSEIAEALRRDSVRIAAASLTGGRSPGANRDPLRRDSLAVEARASDRRMRAAIEGRRIDSLLRIENAVMSGAAARLARVQRSFSNSREKAKLQDLEKRRFQTEERIAAAGAAIAASAAERDRIRGVSGADERRIGQGRASLAALLFAAETRLSEKLAEREALEHVDEMILLDSAVKKTKDELNGAIEQKAMRKKGAAKLIERYEDELSALMGKVDEAKRRYPQIVRYESRWAGAVSAAEKRRILEKYAAAVASQIAPLTARRNQAKRNLDEYDRTRASPAETWPRSVAQPDGAVAAQSAAIPRLAALRDSIDERMSMLRSMVEGLSAVTAAETRKAGSVAEAAKRRWSELSALRARVRGDSVQNEAARRAGLMRLQSAARGGAARMRRPAADNALADTLGRIATDIEAVMFSIESKQSEISALKRRRPAADFD